MKLKQIYIANLVSLAFLVITLVTGLASGAANGLLMPLLCAFPIFLFLTGGSVFVTLYTMKDKKLIDANEYQQLKKRSTNDRAANALPLG